MTDSRPAQTVTCPYCGGRAALLDGSDIYPHRGDLVKRKFYACRPCHAWVGCHPGTTKPLGRLADQHLRKAKQAVHALLDPEWQTVAPQYRGKARRDAYARLASDLGIAASECHVGMFDLERCRRAAEALRTWRGPNG